MTEFKGFNGWIEIFKGGRQTDSQGVEHDGNALIDKAVATFNASRHEPPAVIGHPAHDAPAYGWVEGLRKDVRNGTAFLSAKFKQVVPEFEEMVKSGRFKKRSAAFYPDGSLRHVGFLGATPPAVKGLAEVAFGEGDATVFEFAEDGYFRGALGDVFRRLREWMIEKFDQDTADRVVPNWTIEDIRAAPADPVNNIATYSETRKEERSMQFKEFIQRLKELVSSVDTQAADPPAGKTFSETDIEAARKQAADEAARQEREKLTAEFAEKERTARQNARKAEIAGWCESMIKAGKMTPAWVKYGVPDMMLAFAGMEGEIEFGEGDGKVKATLYDRFKAFFETEMPKVIEFKEIATRDKDPGGQGDAGARLSALVAKKQEADKTLTYSAAFAEVQRENPDLAREYLQEIGG